MSVEISTPAKKQFKKPTLEVITFDGNEVVRASGGTSSGSCTMEHGWSGSTAAPSCSEWERWLTPKGRD